MKMGQKILVAFDDSENAMRAVEHLANNFKPDTTVTLFSVLLDTAGICQMDSKELTPYFRSQQSAFCTLEDKKKELVQEAMKKAKRILVNSGFDESNIRTKLEPKKKGVGRDIAAEAKEGYDMIIMGRRGLSGIKEMFLGSVSQKVISLAKDISVSVID